MGEKTRTCIYLINGRLEMVLEVRKTGRGPWPKPRYRDQTLFARITGGLGDFAFEPGPEFTYAQLEDCMHLYRGGSPSSFDATVWGRVPDDLLTLIEQHVAKFQSRAVERWKQHANEETATGALFAGIDDDFSFAGWRAEIRYVEGSKVSKEPTTGADLALVLEVFDEVNQKRAFKSLWVQVKKTKHLPKDPKKLPRVSAQMAKMLAFTKEAYVLVCSQDGVKAYRHGEAKGGVGLDTLIPEAMRCRAADPSARLFADSMNCQRVLSVMINGKP